MTKYIDAEKLKAEIDRLKENVKNMEEWQSLCEVLSFIDSLQQEQLEVKLENWQISDAEMEGLLEDYLVDNGEPKTADGIRLIAPLWGVKSTRPITRGRKKDLIIT